jgi:hypothetical protein
MLLLWARLWGVEDDGRSGLEGSKAGKMDGECLLVDSVEGKGGTSQDSSTTGD